METKRYGMETWYGIIRTPTDAILIFEACRTGRLGCVQRRLSEKERQLIRSGSVFVWDEKEAGMRRWTDGKSWSASRVSGSFLTYKEMEGKRGNGFGGSRRGGMGKTPDSGQESEDERRSAEPDGYKYRLDGLIKQSYSLTTKDGKHMHLISYYSRNADDLPQPSKCPEFNKMHIPPDIYPESSLNEGPSSGRVPMQPPSYPHPHGPVHPGYHIQHPQQRAYLPSPNGTPPWNDHAQYAPNGLPYNEHSQYVSNGVQYQHHQQHPPPPPPPPPPPQNYTYAPHEHPGYSPYERTLPPPHPSPKQGPLHTLAPVRPPYSNPPYANPPYAARQHPYAPPLSRDAGRLAPAAMYSKMGETSPRVTHHQHASQALPPVPTISPRTQSLQAQVREAAASRVEMPPVPPSQRGPVLAPLVYPSKQDGMSQGSHRPEISRARTASPPDAPPTMLRVADLLSPNNPEPNSASPSNLSAPRSASPSNSPQSLAQAAAVAALGKLDKGICK